MVLAGAGAIAVDLRGATLFKNNWVVTTSRTIRIGNTRPNIMNPKMCLLAFPFLTEHQKSNALKRFRRRRCIYISEAAGKFK